MSRRTSRWCPRRRRSEDVQDRRYRDRCHELIDNSPTEHRVLHKAGCQAPRELDMGDPTVVREKEVPGARVPAAAEGLGARAPATTPAVRAAGGDKSVRPEWDARRAVSDTISWF